MKKIIKLHWNNYKNSDSGKEVIAAFDKLTDPDATVEELYELACRFDPECFNNSSENEKKNDLKYLDFLDAEIREIKSEIECLRIIGYLVIILIVKLFCHKQVLDYVVLNKVVKGYRRSVFSRYLV